MVGLQVFPGDLPHLCRINLVDLLDIAVAEVLAQAVHLVQRHLQGLGAVSLQVEFIVADQDILGLLQFIITDHLFTHLVELLPDGLDRLIPFVRTGPDIDAERSRIDPEQRKG